jgi:hypothetical protein
MLSILGSCFKEAENSESNVPTQVWIDREDLFGRNWEKLIQ